MFNLIVGSRVRLYERPYCRKFWDGKVIDAGGLSGECLVEFDDGVVGRTRIDRLELLDSGEVDDAA